MLLFDAEERSPGDDLRLELEASSRLDDDEKEIVRNVIEGMLLKHDAKRVLTPPSPGRPRPADRDRPRRQRLTTTTLHATAPLGNTVMSTLVPAGGATLNPLAIVEAPGQRTGSLLS